MTLPIMVFKYRNKLAPGISTYYESRTVSKLELLAFKNEIRRIKENSGSNQSKI